MNRPPSLAAASAGLACCGDAGLDACTCGCRNGLGTLAPEPNAFANAIAGMKWLALGVGLLFLIALAGSSRR